MTKVSYQVSWTTPKKKQTELSNICQSHIDSQLKRVSKSLTAMGKAKCARLYLAAYCWPDNEDGKSYARSKGYGIIQPNGSDLTVHVKAEGKLD